MTATKILGMDTSHWNDNNSTAERVNFQKAYNAGARFVFQKVSQGVWVDEDILFNWKTAKAAGLLRGGYHFLTWDKDPKLQAQYFWSILQSDPPELPPVLDFEWWGTNIPGNALDLLRSYVVEIERLSKRTPIIYTGAYFWKDFGSTNISWIKYPLWLAWYTENFTNVQTPLPWAYPTFWQFTSHGDGLLFGCESLNVDLDYYLGNMEGLLAMAGNFTPPPTTNPPTLDIHFKVTIPKQILRDDANGNSIGYVYQNTIVSGVTDIKNTPNHGVWARFESIDGWLAITYAGKDYLVRV